MSVSNQAENEGLQAQREMAAKGGFISPEFEWLAKKDPAFEKARTALSAQVFTPENPHFPLKYRELVVAVVLALRHYPTVERHVRRALSEGATMQEAIEAFQVATIPGGMPVLHYALPALIAIDSEQNGQGEPPSSAPAVSSAEPADLATVQQEMKSKRGYTFSEFDWLASKDPEFEKARLTYSKYIYIPDNPVLPVKYREIINSVVLSYRHYHTVGVHIQRALREGATMQEIIEAFEAATIPGGMPVMHFALPHLMAADKEQ